MGKVMSPGELEKLMGMEMPDRGILELLAECVLSEGVSPKQAERLVHAGYIAVDKERGEGYATTQQGNDTIKWYLPDVAQKVYEKNEKERFRKGKEFLDALWRSEAEKKRTE